ncbi:uncharacterized protein EI97DRAFT_449912 [Westerdykella ornata]|uniref:DUF4470 domain-containing protein n=1 Tax=Westerdykella ornata TaxID=318751 RepID=A0A6A6JMM1_WESOR|nr:uncharacterized protein EI97DRAFT_449912 [Westerdykella ornata]KAF2277188.1 hypothetical protein EI97DRAFT_449912 [Westerdykella ornata]
MATITPPGWSRTSICANRYAGQQGCQMGGRFACKACLLVAYCGPVCQKAHWSPLLKSTWQPGWALERRTPAFVGGLLFGASGDLRNVVRTIAMLPEDFRGKVSVTLNDRDFGIVARNIIMLLVIFLSQELDEAVESVIHLWYSAFIKDLHMDLLDNRVRPLVETVCGKIGSKSPRSLLGKTWVFGSRSLRVVLRKEEWLLLPSHLQLPHNWSKSRAQEVRTACTMAEERRDYRERRMLSQLPSHPLCADKFRRDGILLLFGFSIEDFSTPNPTIFGKTEDWPMNDSADPFDGWDLREVLQIHCGPASNDIYGKLHWFLTHLLSRFYHRVSNLEIQFELLNFDAEILPDHLNSLTPSRFPMFPMADILDLQKHCGSLDVLLDGPHDNPHATLVTLFMNAVDEMADGKEEEISLKAEMMQLMKYLSPKGLGFSQGDPWMVNMLAARPLVRDVETFFDRYMEIHRFKEAEKLFGLKMKEPHTIIEPWPTRLKLRHGERGWEDEFKIRHSSAHFGCERYVEWKRIDSIPQLPQELA